MYKKTWASQIFTFGIRVPAGIFIPGIAIGASLGRAVGIIMEIIQSNHSSWVVFNTCSSTVDCITPGVCIFALFTHSSIHLEPYAKIQELLLRRMGVTCYSKIHKNFNKNRPKIRQRYYQAANFRHMPCSDEHGCWFLVIGAFARLHNAASTSQNA